jgi:hypothetical protein
VELLLDQRAQVGEVILWVMKAVQIGVLLEVSATGRHTALTRVYALFHFLVDRGCLETNSIGAFISVQPQSVLETTVTDGPGHVSMSGLDFLTSPYPP